MRKGVSERERGSEEGREGAREREEGGKEGGRKKERKTVMENSKTHMKHSRVK